MIYPPVHHQEEPNILLVDDSEINRKLITEMLSQHGYRVHIAEDGIQALQGLRDCKPDLILLDIRMPEMDGYEFCQILKSDNETKDIPIIFFSSITKISEKIKAFSMGAADFITKPIQSVEVVVRIEYQLKLAKLQREILEKNYCLEQEIKHRRHVEALLLNKTNQLKQEVEQRKSMELLLRDRNIRLTQAANIDVLTQVANRRYFEIRFAREWQRAIRENYPLSIVLCDIDYFKGYNDHYGHQAGDRCLHQVAQTLANTVNLFRDLVARYGGEEFVIVLPDTDEMEAIGVVQNIQASLAEQAIAHEKSPISDYVTLSFGGITRLPNTEISTEILIKKADEHLYRAKRQGRNQVCWHNNEV